MEQYSTPPRNIFEAIRIQRILWLATFVAPVLLYVALTWVFKSNTETPVELSGDMVTAYRIFVALAVVMTVVLPLVSLRIPHWVLSRQDAASNPYGATTVALTLSCVCCEFASLSWSPVVLLTRDLRYAIGMLLPALVMLRHWPMAERINELTRNLGRKA